MHGAHPSSDRRIQNVLEQQAKFTTLSPEALAKEIKTWKTMFNHARNLEFEEAAKVRDVLHKLKTELMGIEKT